METTISVPAIILSDHPRRIEWPELLAVTGLPVYDAHDLMRDVGCIITDADRVLGIEVDAIPSMLPQWDHDSVMAMIGYSLTYIGGLTVYRLYDGRVVIVPPKPVDHTPRPPLPKRATIQEINEIMTRLNLTPAKMGRALGYSGKNPSAPIHAMLRGLRVPNAATTAKIRSLG